MNRTDRLQATSDAILAATLEVLGEHGLKGSTTRAIAERAGVNEVTLFRRFGSKQALITAAIAAKATAFPGESIVYTGDIEADLIRLTTDYQAILSRIGPFARSLLTEVPFDESVAPSLDPLRGVLMAVGGLLKRYQREGVLEPESVETQIPALLGPIVMPVVTGGLGLLPPDDLSGSFDAPAHVRRFLRGRATS